MAVVVVVVVVPIIMNNNKGNKANHIIHNTYTILFFYMRPWSFSMSVSAKNRNQI